MTEDIDLTFKIIRNGNKDNRVIYADDVVIFTEGVLSLKDLIKQRFRWKFGRTQTFWKNKGMFFNSDRKYTRSLTWLYLPYALFSDLAFFMEPLLVGYLLGLLVVTRDLFTLLSAIVVITVYYFLNIVAEETISKREKILLVLLSPFMYFFFYLLSYVEYVALLKTLFKLKSVPASTKQGRQTWVPVERSSSFQSAR